MPPKPKKSSFDLAAKRISTLSQQSNPSYESLADPVSNAVDRERIMKDTKKQQHRAIRKRARRLELVYLAVDYFQERMSKRRRILTDQIEKVENNTFTFSPA